MKTFEEIAKDPSGTHYEDWFDEGVRCLIMRGPSALCAYLGVTEDHPLAGKSYEDFPLSVHGGLTFAGKGDGKFRPEGFYWYGWDYGHCDDVSFYDLKTGAFPGSVKWTIQDVKAEVESALWDFKKLMKFSEKVTPQRPAEKEKRG